MTGKKQASSSPGSNRRLRSLLPFSSCIRADFQEDFAPSSSPDYYPRRTSFSELPAPSRRSSLSAANGRTNNPLKTPPIDSNRLTPMVSVSPAVRKSELRSPYLGSERLAKRKQEDDRGFIDRAFESAFTFDPDACDLEDQPIFGSSASMVSFKVTQRVAELVRDHSSANKKYQPTL